MTCLKSLVLIGGVLAFVVSSIETHAEEQDTYIVSREETASQRLIKINLAFMAELKQRVVTDSGSQGPTSEDEIDGNGVLRDLNGKEIGRFDSNQRITGSHADGEMRLVVAEYAFGDGRDSFLLAGAELFPKSFGVVAEQGDLDYGVATGTGTFAGARGECHVKRSAKGQYAVNCLLFVPEY